MKMASGSPNHGFCPAATHTAATAVKPCYDFKRLPKPTWKPCSKPAAPSPLLSATGLFWPPEHG